MNRKTLDIAFILALLVLVTLLTYISFLLRTGGLECVIDPLSYGSQTYSKDFNMDIYGTAYGFNEQKSVRIEFNQNGTTIEETRFPF